MDVLKHFAQAIDVPKKKFFIWRELFIILKMFSNKTLVVCIHQFSEIK